MSARLPATSAIVAAVLLTTTSGWADAVGTLEVRVTDHRAGIGDFAAVRVELAEVALHARGQPRGQGWVVGLPGAPALDVVPLKDGRWARAGAGTVPAGRYDAVRVRFGAVRGTLQSGELAVVRPVGSIVAVDLTVAPERVAVLLVDLYVEDVSDHQPGEYLVKVRAVTTP